MSVAVELANEFHPQQMYCQHCSLHISLLTAMSQGSTMC